MPIRAQFTWSETEKVILLNIPLKGTSPKKVDIFGKTCYTFGGRGGEKRVFLPLSPSPQPHNSLPTNYCILFIYLATELFLKVNFPPYLLLLDLSKPVNDLQIRAKVNNGVLVITMNKVLTKKTFLVSTLCSILQHIARWTRR